MDNQTRINKRQGDSFVLFFSFQNQSAVWFIAKALGIWKSTKKETSFSPNGYVTAEVYDTLRPGFKWTGAWSFRSRQTS